MNRLTQNVWTTPDSYFGHNPVGEYVVATQHRDSDALARSNYRRILADLSKAAAGHEESVYDWRASHWAVGWVEYLMVKPDAPEAVLELAAEILEGLDDYPVYDESDFSDLETTEAEEYWAGMSVADRVDLIQRHGRGVSIFAARRDYIPSDDTGSLMEALR